VTNLLDSGPGSLRRAIVDTPAGGTVDFQPGLSGTITLTGGELALTKDLTIAGPGANVITVSGNNASRVFEIAGSVTGAISGLTIADGRIFGSGGGILNNGTLTVTNSTIIGNSALGVAMGGGIWNRGTLTVTDSILTVNSATASGGAIENASFGLPLSRLTITRSSFISNSAIGVPSGASGGGIDNQGVLTVTDSPFSFNSATFGGGIFSHGGDGLTATVTNSTFSTNSALSGGGISDAGLMTLAGSTVYDNFAGDSGGGVFNSGVLTITGSTVSGNLATSGGGVFNDLGTLKVAGSTVSDNLATNQSGAAGGGIDNAGTLTVQDAILSGNVALGYGGGISNGGILTVLRATLTGNRGDRGGGLNAQGNSQTEVLDSTFRDNQAMGPSSGNGGGIDAANAAGGLMDITGSTFSNNTAFGSGGAVASGGGAVFITNSTLVGNEAVSHFLFGGGGVGVFGGNFFVQSSTIVGNRSSEGGGGVNRAFADFGSFTARNTIIADNQGPASAPDIGGPITSQGHNLIGDGTGGSGFADTDLIGTSANPIDPRLGPLQDNGGPTQTMALLASSPALNAGDPAQLGAADQRGVVRSGGVNIGAYQASASAFVLTAPATATAGVPFDLVVTVVDAFGQTAVGYRGTVTFSSSDKHANLPDDYTFTAADGGTHTFSGVSFKKKGHPQQSLTVTDTVVASIFGSIDVVVQKPGHGG
jgi:hypothetical protein